MDKIVIRGGERLIGEVAVSGSKNAALPLFAASLLTEGVSCFHNVPDLRDIHTIIKALKNMGVTILLISETEYITGEFRATEIGVSYLTDNLLFMRYFELNGVLHRSIGVLKKRMTNHEKTLREFQITGEGFKVGEPLTGMQGILKGIPEIIKKGD